MTGASNTTRRYPSRPKPKRKVKPATVPRKAKLGRSPIKRAQMTASEDTESCSSSDTEIVGQSNDANQAKEIAIGEPIEVEGNVEPTVTQDPFAFVDGPTCTADSTDQRGELCELHSYDSRTNQKGEEIVLRTGSKYEYDEEAIKSPEAALVLTRYIRHGKVLFTSLAIRSPYIKKALKKIIGSYPGVNVESQQDVILHEKPHCLFHYRHQLREYAETLDNPTGKQHVEFCLSYMERALRQELSAYNSMLADTASTPRMDFDGLWMVYEPGSLVYMKEQDSEYIYRFKEMEELEDNQGHRYWSLELDGIESNGKDFGYVTHVCKVHNFNGYKVVTDLAVFPLAIHKERDRIQQELLERGKKYVSLKGVHYRMYRGAPKAAAGPQSESCEPWIKQFRGHPLP